VHSPDANVQAKGTLALNDTGQSNLAVQADTPSLEAVARLFGQKGVGHRQSGRDDHRQQTRSSCRRQAHGQRSRVQGQSALQLASDFKVQARDLAFAHAQVSRRYEGNVRFVGGQNINELTAKTEYCDKTLAFDIAAKQPQRSLSAGGSLMINPDQQQVSLTRLALQTQNIEWQTAPRLAPRFATATEGIRSEVSDSSAAARKSRWAARSGARKAR
jgi:hypothetical protein